MGIQLAYHGITWGSKNEEFLKFIDDVASLKIFQGVEVFVPVCDYYEDKPKDFDKLLAERKLKLACLYAGGTFWDKETQKKEIEDNRRVLRFLQAHQGDRMVFGPHRIPEGGIQDEHFEEMARVMNMLGAEALKMGIKCGIHPHLWTSIEKREAIEKILSFTDPSCVFLAPDTAHLFGAGIDPVEFFETHIKRIVYVHVKDWSDAKTFTDVKMTSANEQLPCFCELGKGPVPLPKVFDVLKKNNYNGWLTVELDSTLRTPLESAKISADYLAKHLL